jgi:hypothetical protein
MDLDFDDSLFINEILENLSDFPLDNDMFQSNTVISGKNHLDNGICTNKTSINPLCAISHANLSTFTSFEPTKFMNYDFEGSEDNDEDVENEE